MLHTYEGYKMYSKYFKYILQFENLKGRDYLRNLDVDKRIILECILNIF
jgi:hypothetical protein